jgi:hypothetical protein
MTVWWWKQEIEDISLALSFEGGEGEDKCEKKGKNDM